MILSFKTFASRFWLIIFYIVVLLFLFQFMNCNPARAQIDSEYLNYSQTKITGRGITSTGLPVINFDSVPGIVVYYENDLQIKADSAFQIREVKNGFFIDEKVFLLNPKTEIPFKQIIIFKTF